jgi:hypothetical protein
MGFSETDPRILALKAKGLIPPAPGEPRGRREKVELVEPSFCVAPLAWVIPLHVTPGDNNRGKSKIGRAGHERRVVSRHLGGKTLAYLAAFARLAADGQAVTVRLTRLGGRGCDSDNAVAAMKYVRDTVALMMGFEDGPNSPLRFVVGQEPGGPCGVRVELEAGA